MHCGARLLRWSSMAFAMLKRSTPSSRPRSAVGSLENADLVGTDLALAVHNVVLPAIDNRPGPSPYLQKLVADGNFGFKSGEGFRKWSQEQQAALHARLVAH